MNQVSYGPGTFVTGDNSPRDLPPPPSSSHIWSPAWFDRRRWEERSLPPEYITRFYLNQAIQEQLAKMRGDEPLPARTT